MMSNKKDRTMMMMKNAWAFPSPAGPGNKGMRLRDHFAGQALAGLLAAPHTKIEDNDGIRSIAELSYDIADAMLNARSKNVEEE